MNRKQEKFLDNMTPAQAEAVIAKFKGDPAIAADRSDAAYHAFKLAWEMLHPFAPYMVESNRSILSRRNRIINEYWQRHDRARADGGVQFHLISS